MLPSYWRKSPWDPENDEIPDADKFSSPLNNEDVIDGMQSPIVTLIAGAEKEEFTIPEKHLCAVGFFRRTLTTGLKETHTKVIDLPEDSPQLVRIFLLWLLRATHNCTATIHDFEPIPQDPIRYLTQIIILADKWQIPEFAAFGFHLFWSRTIDMWNKQFFIEQMLASWDALQDLRARYLVLHAVLVKFRYDADFKPQRAFSMITEIRDAGFWAAMCKYEKLFDMAVEDDTNENLAEAAHSLIEGVLRNEKPSWDRLLRYRFEGLEDKDAETINEWIEELLAP